MRKRVFEIIQIGNKSDTASCVFDYILATVICINVVSMFLETFEHYRTYLGIFHAVEAVTVVVFCMEYILRIWTADFLYPDKGRWKAALRFLISFDGVVELLTILPFFYLKGLVAFRMLRVVRIFHLFRLNAQYDSFNVITKVLYEKRNQIASSVFILFVLMLASSLCMYSAEHEAQPEQFSNAFSGIWWSVATLLTVGYGDIYPVTIMGKLMAIVIAFLGVGVVAIPTGIISAGFVEQYHKELDADYVPFDISQIGEVVVDGDSHLTGKTIAEILEEYNMRAYMVLRQEMAIVATQELRLKEGDIIIIQAENIVKKRTSMEKSTNRTGRVCKNNCNIRMGRDFYGSD